MMLYELWLHAPRCFVFVRNEQGHVEEYIGGAKWRDAEVRSVLATDYPMFKHVLEVVLENQEQ